MIDLLMHCGNDNTIANTARVSMELDGEWANLPEDYTEKQRDRLIKYLATHHHTSPFRHNSITIKCNVPIFLARQLGKHQVGMSWNEVSRRYVDTDIEFFTPENWRAKPDGSIKQGSGGVVENQNICKVLYEHHIEDSLELYDYLVEVKKVAPEMARMVLPQSMMTQFIWTGSLMAFAHVYKLRIDGHAQVEAQDFAKELNEIIKPLFPVAWEALVGDTHG
jgi:thymidylate synthase (FAD)